MRRTSPMIAAASVLFSFSALSQNQPQQPAQQQQGQQQQQRPVRMAPGGKWKFNDMARPRPAVIDPGASSTPDNPGQPPSDAVILFDGKDLSKWQAGQGQNAAEPKWIVKDGAMECVPRSGMIWSKEKFGDAQVHIEFATPAQVQGSSQGRGNSGVYLGGHGEIQVLDSWNNDTYPDGQAAAMYGKYPPLVNASRKPGQWQTYDIIIEMPRTDESAKTTPAKLTVLHNGVLAHHAQDTLSNAKDFQIGLQDHGNPVRYRNIWVRKLKGYDSNAESAQAK
jgi:hypothetical protein